MKRGMVTEVFGQIVIECTTREETIRRSLGKGSVI